MGTGVISDEELPLPFKNVPEIEYQNMEKPVTETDHIYTSEDPSGSNKTLHNLNIMV